MALLPTIGLILLATTGGFLTGALAAHLNARIAKWSTDLERALRTRNTLLVLAAVFFLLCAAGAIAAVNYL